jgi:threonylcarbamoyladenosine tRNA methylthiotransferase MtaB
MYVINTCSVTENADKQFKQVVKKAMKLNNKAFVAAGLLCAVKTGRISS